VLCERKDGTYAYNTLRQILKHLWEKERERREEKRGHQQRAGGKA